MAEPGWADLDDEKLLKLRICDLKLKIKGTELEEYVGRLYDELSERGLVFHPPCYLADEWLCPDGEPTIGIPFYLAHPRLKRLEQKMILEVEGGTKAECMKLLRHEAGHAYNYAYLLHRKRNWRRLFGPFSQEYPETYIPRPYSKKFVRHLDDCYAQYHPDEDFAETFAVWLTPGRDWRKEYGGWKIALSKLEYVDSVMSRIRATDPLVTTKKRYWAAENLKQTLGFYYKRKRRAYAEDLPGFFDPDLRRIFTETATGKKVERADRFIRRYRKKIVKSVGLWIGKNNYVINRLLSDLIKTSRELGLYRDIGEEDALLKITTFINTMVMNYLFTGRLKRWP